MSICDCFNISLFHEIFWSEEYSNKVGEPVGPKIRKDLSQLYLIYLTNIITVIKEKNYWNGKLLLFSMFKPHRLSMMPVCVYM